VNSLRFAFKTFGVTCGVVGLPCTSLAFSFALSTIWFGPSQIQIIPEDEWDWRSEVEHLGTGC